MAWRFHGRAHVSTTHPTAWGQCDRCNFLYNLQDLSWQYQWAGPNLQNLRVLVCDICLDEPQPQLKPRILPPDPMPVYNARPPAYTLAEIDWFMAQDGSEEGTNTGLETQDDEPLVQQNIANNDAEPGP